MPIYDYICKNCGEEFETLILGSAKPSCPKCKSEDLTKKMSTFAFRSGGGSAGASAGSGSKCSGCSAGSCATCH